jgi:hypothetical protein
MPKGWIPAQFTDTPGFGAGLTPVCAVVPTLRQLLNRHFEPRPAIPGPTACALQNTIFVDPGVGFSAGGIMRTTYRGLNHRLFGAKFAGTQQEPMCETF